MLADRASVLWTAASNLASTVTVIAPDGSASSFNAIATPFDPSTTASASNYYQYQADITGLKAGTSYRYEVSAAGQLLAADPVQNSFTTPTPGNFSFLVLGDSGVDSAQQLAIMQRMSAEPNISKIIHVGDIAYDSGTFAQFESNYFQLYSSLMSRIPFFTAPGNHEYMTNSAAPYLAVSSAPESSVATQDLGRYYSFDSGDAHFVSLDSNLLGLDGSARMLAWLDLDLAASQKYWKLVFLHHPPYPTGTHLGDPLCNLVRQKVNPIVERHGVPLVLAGHEHGYERSYPLLGDKPAVPGGSSTTYLISGGGGAGLATVGASPQCALSIATFNYLRVDVAGTSLTVTATALDGSVIDRFVVAPTPVLSVGGIVNAGDFSPNIASGSLVSAFGRNFAIRGAGSATTPLPDELGAVSVTANDVPAPLVYVSAGQLNFQMPYEVSGQVTVRVKSTNGVASAVVNIAPVAPSILAAVSGRDLISANNPAVPGSYVTLYATGLGAPAGNCPTGQAAPGAMLVKAPVQVLLGNALLGTMVLQPQYAGLAPGFAGLNQVNVQIPSGLASGTYTLQVSADGAPSTAMNVYISPASSATPSVRAHSLPAHAAIGSLLVAR